MLGSMTRFMSLFRGRPSVALENIEGGFCNMVKSAYVSSFCIIEMNEGGKKTKMSIRDGDSKVISSLRLSK